jgi:hypothetical protein
VPPEWREQYQYPVVCRPDQIGAEITDDFKVKLINVLADLGQHAREDSQSVIIRMPIRTFWMWARLRVPESVRRQC